MRDYVSWPTSDTSRKLAARAKIAYDHPVFTNLGMLNQVSYNRFCQHLHRADGSPTYTVHQFAIEDSEVVMADVALQTGMPIERMWSNYASLPAEAPLTADHIDIVSGFGYVLSAATERLYLALNGIVYYRNGGTWTQIADFRDTVNGITPIITLAGIDHTRVAVAAVYSGANIYDHCELSVIDGTMVDAWKGHLPKTHARVGLAVASDSDMTVHLYVDNWNGKKPVHVRRYYSGVWSAAESILPLDMLDAESSFTVGYATTLIGAAHLVFLTGQLKREFGSTYGIYMNGPDKFTFGRDLIMNVDPTDHFQIFKTSLTRVWAIGKNTAYYADCNGIFIDDPGMDEILETADISSFNANFAINQAGQLSIEVPASFIESHLADAIPGARLDLEISDTGTYYGRLGVFGIDRVVKTVSSDGNSYQVDCSSAAVKKLMDWESDTYFDYLAQAEVHGDPGDLTRLIRFSGSSFDTPESGGLELQSLNDDGMLYTTPASSHGGFIRCKFTNLQLTNTMVGVGLNYGEETLAEAAERLGKKIENTTAAERAKYGLFVIYYPDPIGETDGQVWLVDYNTVRKGYGGDDAITNAWRVIEKVDVTKPAENGACVLAMQYQDGYVRGYWANEDTASLNQIISCQAFLDGEIHPAERENYGRGAIYLRNNTGCHQGFAMSSDCDVIPLHTLAEKFAEVGVPLEDRTDKFPASNGTVLVDSEQILYTGIAGWQNNNGADRVTQELDWVPGEILASAGDGYTTPSGTNVDFANFRGSRGVTPHTHGNNYILQSLNVAAGRTITAVRVWLKKVNFPEDEVSLSINYGNVSTIAEGTKLANFVLSTSTMGAGSKLTEEGGWVTFFLNSDVEIMTPTGGNQYWIMIRRNKNQNHPSSYSYFQYKKMANTTHSGGACYVFCEECDATVAQNGDMAFVVYGKVEGKNREYCIPVKYETGKGLPASDSGSFFAGCAVTISSGEGKNNCYRIIRSVKYTTALSEQLYLFFVDRSPGPIFDIGTQVRAVPAFYGLKRGQSGTYPAAHGHGSQVHLPTSDFALASGFEYFNANEDKTLAEVAEDIARKAGVRETDMHNRGSAWQTEATSQNLIAAMVIPSLDVSETITCKFAGEDAEIALEILQATSSAAQLTITHTDLDASIVTTILDIAADEPVHGEARLSFYDGHISLWVKGRLVISAVTPTITWTEFSARSSGTHYPTVFIPEAGTRVDSFVMDMGKTGAQLLQNLIGEKRVYFQDDVAGRLKIFVNRDISTDAVENFVSYRVEQTDIGLATRVLLEGGEVVEVSSAGNIAQYGNFFKSLNFSEINNLADAQYFGDLTMEDMDLNRFRVEVSGSVDPAIEPTDLIELVFDQQTSQWIVVDAVSHSMRVDENDAVYDMHISGRIAPAPEEE